jgi:hypothetical protein
MSEVPKPADLRQVAKDRARAHGFQPKPSPHTAILRIDKFDELCRILNLTTNREIAVAFGIGEGTLDRAREGNPIGLPIVSAVAQVIDRERAKPRSRRPAGLKATASVHDYFFWTRTERKQVAA